MFNRFYLFIIALILFVACGAEEEKTDSGPVTGSNIELNLDIETFGADLTRIGVGISIALDQSDNPLICHYDSDNDKVLLKTYGTSWSSEEVADELSFIISSTVVDNTGKMHIVYSSASGSKYMTDATGPWVEANYDSDSLTGKSFASICIDNSDKLHISYYDVTNSRLKYSTNSSGTWVSVVLDNTDDAGKYSSIKLDSDGKVHILYFYGESDVIKHITNKTGTWQSETVVSGLGTDYKVFDGRFFSFDFDSGNFLHVSYYDDVNDDLKYTTNKSGSWVVQTVDSYGLVGKYNKIAVDSSDKIHLCYYEQNIGYLKYATNKNGVWQFATIDNPDGTYSHAGTGSDMILDSDDNVHIAYQLYYETGGYNYRNLKYAKITYTE
jgi:hypothetical protein